MEEKPKKSLMERYGIPVNHLDFKYIADCKDGREIEKIVHILRSNEEGYYPDLTTCAENKLKELKPNSRLFRVEEKIKGREALEPNELKPIYDWNENIKTTDKKLQELVKETNSQDPNNLQMPPIRKGGIILSDQTEKEKGKGKEKCTNSIENGNNKTSERIKSTDYNKWDKYDPDEELLRQELAEEREKEEVERKNRLNMQKCAKEPLTITEITDDSKPVKAADKWLNLSEIEKEKLSEDYRLRGNEYFRSKEYDLAVKEYTSAIQCCCKTSVAAFNNRALAYFRQQNFSDSIKDSEESLKLEPNNLKARLRLAEANYAIGKRRESYQLYIDVLQLDATNAVALKAITELRKQFEDLPPPNATRLQIQEETSKNKKKEITKPKPEPTKKLINNDMATSEPTKQTTDCDVPKGEQTKKSVNYDLADLVKPNRVIQNKLFKAAENLGKNMKTTGGNFKEKQMTQEINDRKLFLPAGNQAKAGKKLIEEL